MARTRTLALGGVAGPAFFTVAVIVSAGIRPEYSHYAQFMSELGETGSVSAPIMNFVGFLPAGALIFAGSLAFWDRFGGTWAGSLGCALVSLFAVGMFVSGIFSCDMGCTPNLPTAEQRLHDIAGAITFPSFVLAPLVLGLRFRQLERWKSLFPYAIATSAITCVAVIALIGSVPDRAGTGLFQRVVVGLSFLWLVVVSLRLRAGEASRST